MIVDFNNDSVLQNDNDYQEFLKNNPGRGNLKIRATSASEALPVKGLKIVVSKEIGENTIIFYDGETDESGMINGIVLPTPQRITSDLEAPKFQEYQLKATYEQEKFNKIYNISLCCGISIIQYINVTPNIEEKRCDFGN